MARTPLYSPSPQRPQRADSTATAPGSDAAAPPADAAGALPPPPSRPWLRALQRRERWLWAAAALLLAGAVGWPSWTAKVQRPMTIEQVDAAMRESIAKEPLPAATAAAYEAILPSVVRVVGTPPRSAEPAGKAMAKSAKGGSGKDDSDEKDEDDHREGRSIGTGVVVVDSGLILTNLHVVAGAEKITVTFFDGTESEAFVVNRQPQDDLAVLQAKVLPDDLQAATLRSTQGLSPGDQVLAVGFPFGIGPSASAGVVSGLKREFQADEDGKRMTNLIQFDAAANPGNSGGPLVTMDGTVVGVVTAILNPGDAGTFIGIGFAVPIESAAGAAGMPPF
jgi:S1-C subfamily serine protease